MGVVAPGEKELSRQNVVKSSGKFQTLQENYNFLPEVEKHITSG